MLGLLLGSILARGSADEMPKRGECRTCGPPLRPAVQAALAIRVMVEGIRTTRGIRCPDSAPQLLHHRVGGCGRATFLRGQSGWRSGGTCVSLTACARAMQCGGLPARGDCIAPRAPVARQVEHIVLGAPRAVVDLCVGRLSRLRNSTGLTLLSERERRLDR